MSDIAKHAIAALKASRDVSRVYLDFKKAKENEASDRVLSAKRKALQEKLELQEQAIKALDLFVEGQQKAALLQAGKTSPGKRPAGPLMDWGALAGAAGKVLEAAAMANRMANVVDNVRAGGSPFHEIIDAEVVE